MKELPSRLLALALGILVFWLGIVHSAVPAEEGDPMRQINFPIGFVILCAGAGMICYAFFGEALMPHRRSRK